MELSFKGKENKKNILKNINNESPIILDNDKSYIFKGDNFNIMTKILGANKGFIDLVYIDPPFNTKNIFYVSDQRANTISKEKTNNIAFNDAYSNEEFIKFLYERLVLIYELLSEKGSIYVHTDTKIGHYIKLILDEIFGAKNFKNDITRIKSNPKNFNRKAYGNEKDMLLFYSKNPQKNIWNEVRLSLNDDEINKRFAKVDDLGRRYTTIPLHAPGETSDGITGMPWRGMLPPSGRHWRTSPDEFDKMDELGLIEWSKNGNPRIKKYAEDHVGKKIQDVWTYKDPQMPIYPTQKNLKMLQLIISQSSNTDSIVMDCFAGSGTTLVAAASLGRRFIGIDSSNVAISTMTSRLENYNIDYILV